MEAGYTINEYAFNKKKSIYYTHRYIINVSVCEYLHYMHEKTSTRSQSEAIFILNKLRKKEVR